MPTIKGVRVRTYTVEQKERVKRTSKKWYQEHPEHQEKVKATREITERSRAYSAVRNAVRSGKLVKPAFCHICDKIGRVEAHHWSGYANKLKVEWVCRGCHIRIHSGSLIKLHNA